MASALDLRSLSEWLPAQLGVATAWLFGSRARADFCVAAVHRAEEARHIREIAAATRGARSAMTRGAARLDTRLERIEACCTGLEAAAAAPREQWLASRDAVAAAERRLEVAIPAAIDAAIQLIAGGAGPRPKRTGRSSASWRCAGCFRPNSPPN